jgi:hypothetical protein
LISSFLFMPYFLGSTLVISSFLHYASSVQISAMEDLPLAGVVASFTDSNIHGSTSDFTALVRWGDGNTSSARVQPRAGGGFEVIGTHTYANPGALTLRVEIQARSRTARASEIRNDRGTRLVILSYEGFINSGLRSSRYFRVGSGAV